MGHSQELHGPSFRVSYMRFFSQQNVVKTNLRDAVARDLPEPSRQGAASAAFSPETSAPPTTKLDELSGILAIIGSATSSFASSFSSSFQVATQAIRADPEESVNANSRQLVESVTESVEAPARISRTNIEPDFYDVLLDRLGRFTVGGASSADVSQTTTLEHDVRCQVVLSL
jgi:hypothetical protein